VMKGGEVKNWAEKNIPQKEKDSYKGMESKYREIRKKQVAYQNKLRRTQGREMSRKPQEHSSIQ